jgi:threonine/homoserine/homoserine lactone efflux protein
MLVQAALDRRPWLFHIIMALGGLYLAMVVTNWGDPNL